MRIGRRFALNFTEFVISKLGVMEKKVHEISKIETPPGLSKKLQEISEDIETLLSVSNGTKKIGEAICTATKNGAFSLVGGGDSVAVVKKFGFADKISYISTGGGAMLEYLEGKQLPGVVAIES